MEKTGLKKIISQQKSLGRKPEELIEMAIGAGYTEAKVMPLIIEMFPGFHSTHEEKPDFEHGESVKIWDPAGQSITETRFQKVNDKIQKKFQYYKAHPYVLKRNYRLFFLLGIVGSALLGLFWYHFPVLFWALILGEGDEDGMPWILYLPWAALTWYVFYVYSLQRDLVKKIIADKNHWIYNSSDRKSAWLTLSKKYPRIFNKGNKNQELQDEFWGKFYTSHQSRDFYSGIFHYAVESGSGKNRSTSNYYQTVFAIRLEKTLTNSLLLTPEKKIDRILRKMGMGSDIEVESIEFNKLFKVYRNGKEGGDFMLSVFQKLSPAVQENLIKLSREHSDSSILFSGDTFIFVRKGILFPTKKSLFKWRGMPKAKMHTNFFKKVELDPRDEEYLQEKFENLLTIASDIARFLD